PPPPLPPFPAQYYNLFQPSITEFYGHAHGQLHRRRCYRGVTEVLQRCYRGVTEVLQQASQEASQRHYYRGITEVLQVLQRYYRGITEVLQRYYRGITEVCRGVT